MISRFFIERPRLSAVLSIIIFLMGILAMQGLPIKEYPALTPPQVVVTAVYPGADAETLVNTVAAPLEEAINGVPNMIYMTSIASSSGILSINVFFEVGTDINVAKMDVNNRVQTALPRLPEEVRRQGLQVRERSPDLVSVVTFFSEGQKRTPVEIANYIILNILEDLKRVPGVGDVIVFDEKRYSIRVWLKPDKLAKFNLTPLEVYSAISRQNQQFFGGGIAQEPLSSEPTFSYVVKGEPRLQRVSQFEDIILRTHPDGSALKLKDVATIELSSEHFNRNSFFKKQPVIPVGIFLAPGANALDVAKNVDKTLKELSKRFPSDLKYFYPYQPTVFIEESIKEVIITFIIAVILVILVVYFFLGSLKATLIPILAIPVSIIGSFAGLYVFGFSINLLTLFGLILAIGLVVDDAIIVIENAERIIREERLPPKLATIKAMEEITSPIIAIVLVLSAVFIPASFTGGFTGVFYRQFAITIAISMVLSGVVALTLTPALCALFLEEKEVKPLLPVRIFQKIFEASRKLFLKGAEFFIRFFPIGVFIFLIILPLTYFLIKRLPTALVPLEDRGSLLVFGYLPPGSSLKRTSKVVSEIESLLEKTPEIKEWVAVSGLDLQTFAFRSDACVGWIRLKDWAEREKKESSSFALSERLSKELAFNREALIFVVNPPPIIGMSITGGFELYVQDRIGGSISDLAKYVSELVFKANQRPELMAVRTTLNPNVPHYKVTVDREKAMAYEVEVEDIYKTLAMTLGSYYVNDFNLYGRVFHVNMQAEGEFRDDLRDYSYLFVRSKRGELVSLSALIKIEKLSDALVTERFNMFNAAKVTGEPKPGYTSGDAIKAILEVAQEVLPPGYTIAWSGTSYQEMKAQAKTGWVLAYAVLFIFLILVALYESWTSPLAIIFSVPFAIFGASLGLNLFRLENDVYFQVGLLTLIGLSAKNAILIVEFAEERLKKYKMSLLEATLEAARLRYRPIMMTSFAFIAGALPLMFSSGAGANSRNLIGTTVVTGMLLATLLGIFFIPLFYYLVVKVREKFKFPFKTNGKKLFFLIFLFIFKACSLAPEFKKPEVDLPSEIRVPKVENTTSVNLYWWKEFKDPFLEELIEVALKNNEDLLMAGARVDQALALLQATGTELYPSFYYSGEVLRQRLSEETLNPLGGRTYTTFSLSSLVSYELDLWGRLKNQQKAALSNYLATKAGKEALQISIISSVATTYFELISLEKQIKIAQDFLEKHRHIYEFRKLQFKNGLIDELVVKQAKAEYEATQILLEDLKNRKERVKALLALLTGLSPKELFEKEIKIKEEFPKPLPIPAMLPSEILQRRPDLVEAEERLKAANFEVGVARSLYFPRIFLTGGIGFQSEELANFIRGSATVWNLGISLIGPLFDFGRIKSEIEFKEAQKREALGQYLKTVKTAFREVYEALSNLEASYEKLSSQIAQVETLERVLELSEKKYTRGLVNYLVVLDAQRNLLKAKLNLVSLEFERLKNYVFLYKALGGGWDRSLVFSNF
ncbi:MAG: multidrug efflux RND transporter permease subunit [Thermodesulfobacterium sp.]|nr:multidrug efflux RND transporter permease subunit [Thermodesulfobacterium sp.]